MRLGETFSVGEARSEGKIYRPAVQCSFEPIWNTIIKGDCALHIGDRVLHIIWSDSTLPKLFQLVHGCWKIGKASIYEENERARTRPCKRDSRALRRKLRGYRSICETYTKWRRVRKFYVLWLNSRSHVTHTYIHIPYLLIWFSRRLKYG